MVNQSDPKRQPAVKSDRAGSKSRGQIAVLYAGIIAVLIGAVALGADVAVMYSDWEQMQKTADAAAIAGANYLAGYAFTGTPATGCTGEPDAATTAACTYAVDNGLAVSNLTLTETTASRKKESNRERKE